MPRAARKRESNNGANMSKITPSTHRSVPPSLAALVGMNTKSKCITMSHDGTALVRKAVAGDADALSRLLHQHGPEVQRNLSISRQWQSALEPADVMQVTYLEAFLRIDQFDLDRSEPFRGWLQRIAENNLRDAIRSLSRKKRRPTAPQTSPVSIADATTALLNRLAVSTKTPSHFARQKEQNDRLAVALDALPEDYATAVRLYDLQGLPIEDVARQLGRSTGAVHMLRARAYDRLRELLGAPSGWLSPSA